MNDFPTRLLLHNRAWVANRLELRSRYFESLSASDKPTALWIGCCDARVPAEEITGARPGELIVHRNVANVIHEDDSALNSVLHYSLRVLKVPHLIVCGHTHCSGVAAALHLDEPVGLSDWLAPVQRAAESDRRYETIASVPQRVVESAAINNVRLGIERLRGNPVVQAALAAGTLHRVHGWVFRLESGLIETVCVADRDQLSDRRGREPGMTMR